MEKISYKGRDRLLRGKLNSFDELPEFAKIDFIKIKEVLNKQFNKEISVYVFGSFHHGFWDELSDYDVIIYEKPNNISLNKLMYDKLGFKVDVIVHEKKINYYTILIP